MDTRPTTPGGNKMPYLKCFVKFQHPEHGNYVEYWPGEDPGEDAKYITNPLAWMTEDEVEEIIVEMAVQPAATTRLLSDAELQNMKIRDLMEYARDRGIEIRSGSNKEALIESIKAATNAHSDG